MQRVFISKPWIEKYDDTTRLVTSVSYGGGQKELYFEVENKYACGLCEENVDAFVIAILPWCMANSTCENKVVLESDSRISKQLSLQLQMLYIPTVSKYISYYNEIDIRIKAYNNDSVTGHAVVSGVSGGADSFYTLLKYTQEECEYPITHGICANMGVYGGYSSKHQESLYGVAKEICMSMNLELIYVKSNILLEVYKYQMATNVSYVYMSMGLALQNLIHIYYFSSEVDAAKFNFNEINAEEYDLFNCPMFGNGKVIFYSSGSEVTRMEKLDYISGFPITYDKIRICPNTSDGHQCQKCAKCTLSMCTLDVLGKLEKYSDIYDLKKYKDDYAYHWGYMLLAPKSVPNIQEVLLKYKEKYGKFKLSVYLSCIKKWISRGFTRDNTKRIVLKDVIDKFECKNEDKAFK